MLQSSATGDAEERMKKEDCGLGDRGGTEWLELPVTSPCLLPSAGTVQSGQSLRLRQRQDSVVEDSVPHAGYTPLRARVNSLLRAAIDRLLLGGHCNPGGWLSHGLKNEKL